MEYLKAQGNRKFIPLGFLSGVRTPSRECLLLLVAEVLLSAGWTGGGEG